MDIRPFLVIGIVFTASWISFIQPNETYATPFDGSPSGPSGQQSTGIVVQDFELSHCTLSVGSCGALGGGLSGGAIAATRSVSTETPEKVGVSVTRANCCPFAFATGPTSFPSIPTGVVADAAAQTSKDLGTNQAGAFAKYSVERTNTGAIPRM